MREELNLIRRDLWTTLIRLDKMIGDENLEKMYDIENVVCAEFYISPSMLRQKTRRTEITIPRQVVMWYLCTIKGWTRQSAGDSFNLNHSTVIHAIKVVREMISTDKIFAEKIESIMNTIKNKSNNYD